MSIQININPYLINYENKTNAVGFAQCKKKSVLSNFQLPFIHKVRKLQFIQKY